jgi:hypothetical protein
MKTKNNNYLPVLSFKVISSLTFIDFILSSKFKVDYFYVSNNIKNQCGEI